MYENTHTYEFSAICFFLFRFGVRVFNGFLHSARLGVEKSWSTANITHAIGTLCKVVVFIRVHDWGLLQRTMVNLFAFSPNPTEAFYECF